VLPAGLKRLLSAEAPESSARRRLINQLLADERVQAQIHRQAERSGEPLLSVESATLQQLNTLCADFSPALVERLYPLFSLLLHHLHPQIELRGVDRLQALSQSHQLVYLPAHRSHIDYLLISWALYREQLTLPHIAAGDNLNLPLVGPILRRGGAVFMRRSFLDDPLYTQLFQTYLEQLLTQGLPFEFFIEGGRSRTGRLLAARRGLLGMTLDAWRASGARPLALVPLSINYDLCLENTQYLRELGGKRKRPESLGGLIAAASHLLRRGGGAYMAVGEPLLIEPGSETPPPERLGRSLLRRINTAGIAAPMARLACLLPSPDDEGQERDELTHRLQRLNELLQLLGVSLPRTDPSPRQAIGEALRRGQLGKLGERIVLSDRQAAGLCFYRNTLSHTLILPGLILLLAARLPVPGKSTISRLLRALTPYLDAELSLPEHWLTPSAPGQLRQTLHSAGLIEIQGSQLQLQEHPLTRPLIALAEPIILRQYLLIRVLHRQPGISEFQLLDTCSRLSTHVHFWYGHSAPDYADSRQLEPLIARLQQGELLERRDGRLHAARDLTPILRIGRKLLPSVLLHESERWLKEH